MRSGGYDEVMIVNPVDPDGELNEGVTLMNYHAGQPPEMGGYAGWPGAYGYAEADPYAGYSEPPELVGWGDPYAYGYGGYGPGYAEAEPYYGGYAEDPYAEADPYAGYYGYAEPDLYSGYGYAEPDPYSGYGYAEQDPYAGYYGYAEPDPYSGYGYVPPGLGVVHMPYPPRRPRGETPGVGETYIDPALQGAYAEPEVAGYVRDAPPPFNAGCPMPTNVAGYEEVPPLEGYVPPRDVSPTCKSFTPGPSPGGQEPETFRPLW